MKSSELINLGPRIRKERRSKGISQSDFSKNLGISASYLNLLENGRRTLTVPLLIKIGNELNLSLKDLTVESNKRILADTMEVLSNEIFDDLDITNLELRTIFFQDTNNLFNFNEFKYINLKNRIFFVILILMIYFIIYTL